MTDAGDYLVELFGENPVECPVLRAEADALIAADKARVARVKAEDEARRIERIRSCCPRCGGQGRISSFSHIKGGECFTCGGTGIRSRA